MEIPKINVGGSNRAAEGLPEEVEGLPEASMPGNQSDPENRNLRRPLSPGFRAGRSNSVV
jgi:hypothetical protein